MGQTTERNAPTFGIIGAGMSGILAAIKLQEAGYGFTVFEKADRLGGTWRDNTYPGLACDVPSHIYSYSFALNPEWSRFASPGSEILEYFERVAKEYGVDDQIRFSVDQLSHPITDHRMIIEKVDPTSLSLRTCERHPFCFTRHKPLKS